MRIETSCPNIGRSAPCKEEETLFCKSSTLMMRILIALFLGVIVGLYCHYFENEAISSSIKPIGEIFVRLLKILLGPLFFSTIYMAIINLKSIRYLGDLGLKTLTYYVFSGCLASLLGLTLINFFSPGSGINFPGIDRSNPLNEKILDVAASQNSFATFWNSVSSFVPANISVAFYDGNIIQIMLFAMLFGVVALLQKKTVQPFTDLVACTEKISMGFMRGLMYIAPLGVFALIVDVATETGLTSVIVILKYFFVIIAGILLYSIFLIFIGAYFSKKSPIFMVRLFSPLMLTGFSTCSSSASLPISLHITQRDLALDPSISKFVLSLGTVVNISGTALYEALAVIFLAQVYNIPLSLYSQITIVLVTFFAAMGGAAIPSAGMVTMSVVLTTLHFPLEAIGLVLCVDCILDQFRTAMSVLGDCTGAIIVNRAYDSNSPRGLYVEEGIENVSSLQRNEEENTYTAPSS